jgi:ribosome maturation factor RimP
MTTMERSLACQSIKMVYARSNKKKKCSIYLQRINEGVRGVIPSFFCKKPMITESQIRGLIEEKIGDGPLFIVEVQVNPGNKIKVEMDSDVGLSIDDCVAISRQIEGNLDRELEDFELQVLSAGIGQPLKVERQYTKNVGRDVSLKLADGSEVIGKLLEAGEALKIGLPALKKKKLPEREVMFPLEDILETKVRVSFK